MKMRRTLLRACRRRHVPFLFLFVLSAGPANAGDTQPDSLPRKGPPDEAGPTVIGVTWPEVVRVVDAHPRLAAGRLQTDAARGAAALAGAVPNPTVEGILGQARSSTGDAARVEWGLTLGMPLGWIAQRGSRVETAEAEVAVTTGETSELRREILFQLLSLFWYLSYEQARVTSFEALAAQTSELVQAVSRRVEKGEARPVEAVRVEIELDKVAKDRKSVV
jgi:outer membrane protein TolC